MIKLTGQSGNAIWVNPRHVSVVSENENKTFVTFVGGEDSCIIVAEPAEYVAALVDRVPS